MVIGVSWKKEETQYNGQCGLLNRCIYGQGCALVGKDVFIHGGYGSGMGTGDYFYVLDLVTKTWRAIHQVLGARSLHSLRLVNDKIYIHGGGVRGMKRWDIVSSEVEDIEVEFGTGLSWNVVKRWGDSLEFHERSSSLLMFGGDGSDAVVSFNVERRKWERIEAKGTPPRSRKRHSSCIVGDEMYVYGGMPTENHPGYYSDLFVFHVGPYPTWTRLVEEHRVGRFGASISYVQGRLVIYGGKRKMHFLDARESLMVFDLRRKRFIHDEDILVTGEIEPRRLQRAIVRGNQILLIGGKNGEDDSLHELGMLSTITLSFE